MQERPDPAVGAGRGPDRGARRRDQLRRHDGPRRPLPGRAEAPCVLGYEVAGEVESVGEGVDDSQVGDRVMAGTRFGGQAELVAVPAAQVLPLPERLSFEQGAAFPVNYGTAYAALIVMGSLRAGNRVLIHAAGGGVGISATQIARNAGAEIFGTASAGQARGDPRPGRHPRDRLPRPRLRGRGDADHRRRGRRPDHRRARPDLVPQGLPAAAPGRPAGHVRALGELRQTAPATSRRR